MRQDLGTTQRYMHLSTAAIDAAIRLLETGTDTSRAPWRNSGGGGNGGPEGPCSLRKSGGGGSHKPPHDSAIRSDANLRAPRVRRCDFIVLVLDVIAGVPKTLGHCRRVIVRRDEEFPLD